jgi:hypothetical protein
MLNKHDFPLREPIEETQENLNNPTREDLSEGEVSDKGF